MKYNSNKLEDQSCQIIMFKVLPHLSVIGFYQMWINKYKRMNTANNNFILVFINIKYKLYFVP